MTLLKDTTLGVALKHFFGAPSGGGTNEFMEEFKKLTQDDKNEFKELLSSIGYTFKS